MCGREGIAQGLSSVRASQLKGEAVKGPELTRIKFARVRAPESGGLARASSTRLGPAGPCCLGKAWLGDVLASLVRQREASPETRLVRACQKGLQTILFTCMGLPSKRLSIMQRMA